MIISKNIEIKVSKRIISKLREQGLIVKINDIINIPVEYLDKGSHQKVDVKCEICGCEKSIMYQKYWKNIKNGGVYSCSSKCSQFKVKKTSIDKFGKEYYTQTSQYRKQVENTNMNRYGVKCPLESIEIKEKIAITNLERYGNTNPFGSMEIKEKIAINNLEKYGNINPSKNENIKSKISSKLIESWKKKYIGYYDDLKIISYSEGNYHINCDLNQDHSFFIINTLLHNRRVAKTVLCTICNPTESRNTSGYELELKNFIEEIYQGEIDFNNRSIINPLELDIFLPELKLAIEFNGLYWHSEQKKNNNYHLNKHTKCKNVGVELIQVYEDDWLYKNKIVKSILRNKIIGSLNKIYARNCNILKVSDKESVDFLTKNHIQGGIHGKVNIGLYYHNELVSLMSFGKLRKALGNNIIDNNNYELLRYCNKIDYSIVGGASKILKFFIRNYDFNELVTYYDKSFGYKNLYENIGFEYVKDTNPNYFYIVKGLRKHRYLYRKDILVKQGYDSNKTEREIMSERKIYRIYNSGNIKYVLKNKP